MRKARSGSQVGKKQQPALVAGFSILVLAEHEPLVYIEHINNGGTKMKCSKLVEPVVAEARKLGFKVSYAGKRNVHLRFDKDGIKPVFFSSSPSDHRAVLNGIAKLRRAAAQA